MSKAKTMFNTKEDYAKKWAIEDSQFGKFNRDINKCKHFTNPIRDFKKVRKIYINGMKYIEESKKNDNINWKMGNSIKRFEKIVVGKYKEFKKIRDERRPKVMQKQQWYYAKWQRIQDERWEAFCKACKESQFNWMCDNDYDMDIPWEDYHQEDYGMKFDNRIEASSWQYYGYR